MKKILILMIFMFSLVLFGCNSTQTNKPTDKLVDAKIEGLTNETIDCGQSFDLLTGVKAYDYDNTDITENIVVEGTVDVNTAGEYTITYKITGENEKEITGTRVITVNAPVLADARFEGIMDRTLFNGQPFNPLSNIKAFDHNDEDITDSIIVEGTVDVNTAGDYTITYKVTGENGNLVTKERVITVLPAKPKVQLLFPTFEIHQGEDIDLFFCVTATSETDGDISANVYIKNNGGFNKDVVGTYTIIYGVKDSTGLEGTNQRVIIVNP